MTKRHPMAISAEVSVAVMVYRSVPWMRFVLEGLRSSHTDIPYDLMVVGNDPSLSLLGTHHLTHVYTDPTPEAHYLVRVYRCWNWIVDHALTPWVVLMNSDMYVFDGWLDALWAHRHEGIPTSLLVESGAIPSFFPEYVMNCGRTPQTFDRERWWDLAGTLRKDGMGEVRDDGLFMPVLLNKAAYIAAGGYPEGNVSTAGGVVSGDRWLFEHLASIQGPHRTIMDSVVYHVQEGEMRS